MFNENESFFQCPYCFETISMICEELYGNQKYIEDCEVCCHPIEIEYFLEEGKVVRVEANRA